MRYGSAPASLRADGAPSTRERDDVVRGICYDVGVGTTVDWLGGELPLGGRNGPLLAAEYEGPASRWVTRVLGIEHEVIGSGGERRPREAETVGDPLRRRIVIGDGAEFLATLELCRLRSPRGSELGEIPLPGLPRGRLRCRVVADVARRTVRTRFLGHRSRRRRVGQRQSIGPPSAITAST